MLRSKHMMAALSAAFIAGFILRGFLSPAPVHGQETLMTDEVSALKREVAAIRELLPDQAHAMADVSFHFANLYFAGQAENWELAQFYHNEVKSHLRWAVRIKPVRPLSAGGELALQPVLEFMETGVLSQVDQAIKNRQMEDFGVAYEAVRKSCFDCHQAAEKAFLRLRIPLMAPEPMLYLEASKEAAE